MLGLFPNKGVGFNIKRKHWPEGLHYEIKRAVYKVFHLLFSRIETLHFMALNLRKRVACLLL